MEEKANKYKSEPKSKWFYLTFSICLIAVIATAYVAYNSLNRSTILNNDHTNNNQILEGQPANSEPFEDTQKQESTCTSSNCNKKKDTKESTNRESKAKTVSSEIKPNTVVFPTSKEIIKEFSDSKPVYSKTLNDWRNHPATDFKAEVGSKVSAISDGKVTDVYSDPTFGTTISIEHPGGIIIYYCGVDPQISKNDTVKAGQVIGVIGEVPIEIKDGGHLHLSVKKDGKFIDPMSILTQAK